MGVKMKYQLFIILLIILPFCILAQEHSIDKSVFGNGGGDTSNSNYKIRGTVGQVAIGITENASNIIKSGFWYQTTTFPSMIEGTVILLTISPPEGNIEDVEITAGEFTVNPSISGYYTIPVPPGTYNVTASLDDYTEITIEDVVVEANLTTNDVNITLIDWEPIEGQYQMTVFASISINSVPFVYEVNNIVAAFGPDRTSDCRCLAEWLSSFNVWHFIVESDDNSGTEEINFMFYDNATNLVYVCSQIVNFENGLIIGDPFDPFELTAIPSQVENLLIWIEDNDVNLTWEGNGGTYHIYRSENPDTDFSEIDTTTDTFYIDNIGPNEEIIRKKFK